MKFVSSSAFVSLFLLKVNPVAGCPYLSANMDTTTEEAVLLNESKKNHRNLGPRGRGGGRGGGSNNNNPEFEFQCDFTGGTPEEAIAAVKQDIINMVDNRQRLGPKLVRLAFHDCVGGCDGSVDTTNPNNFGLEIPISRLRPVVDCYESSALTRADIWALAGLTAAEYMQDDDDGVTYSFEYYGRSSLLNDETGKDGDDMPGNHLTTQGLLDYFKVTFDFSTDETVAIMGVHTLGFLDDDNSGFEGRWVRNPTRTDNDFYDQITTRDGEPHPSFVQQLADNGQYLWRRTGRGGRSSSSSSSSDDDNRKLRRGGNRGGGGRGGRGGPIVMLNADMALVCDMEGYLNPDTGFASCVPTVRSGDSSLPECPEASTRDIVMEFADNNRLWLTSFRDALTKITNTVPGGIDSLSKVNS